MLVVAMASFKGFDDDDDVGDEGPHSNGPVPELDENAEAKAIGVYKERRSAKVRQTGGKIELRTAYHKGLSVIYIS